MAISASEIVGETSNITSTSPPLAAAVSIGSLAPTLLTNHLHGDDIGDGWTLHTCPHNGLPKYFYHSDLKLVTRENMEHHETRCTLLQRYAEIAGNTLPSETFWDKLEAKRIQVVNHATETSGGDPNKPDEGRANYWIYLHNFPCHHKFSDHAETAALRVLQLMAAQNLTNADRTPHTPFSMEDIQRYIDFFEFSDKLKDKPADVTDVSVAKNIIIANIMANFYLYRSRNPEVGSEPSPDKREMSLLKRVITVACSGIPPNYTRRFDTAYKVYSRSLQPASWISFLDLVRKERAAANVLSGLLLASSVAFLAIPDLLDVAQFFIIVSIGLSLSCVVMGFNGEVDEELSRLQHVSIHGHMEKDGHYQKVRQIGYAMEQHFIMLLLSVLCFYLSVLVFTAHNIYTSVSMPKSFTVFVMATCSLIIIMGIILHWNRRFWDNDPSYLHSCNS